MDKVQILHNNRCSKSRSACNWLEESNKDFEIINYIENPLTAKEIKDLLKKLNLPASAIIRKGEAVFKENFKGKDLSEAEWIQAMVDFPKLIERPIVIKGNKAAIGRPLENVIELF